jgi:hypothetical protein
MSAKSCELSDWVKARLRFNSCDDVVILFIPSHDKKKKRLPDRDQWASAAVDLFGRLYGGATAFTGLSGTWMDGSGNLIDDEPIMVQSLARREDVEDPEKLHQLSEFCKKLGRETKQGAVGLVLNDAMHYITKY